MDLKTRANKRAEIAILRYSRGDSRAFRWAFLWLYVADSVDFPCSSYFNMKKEFDEIHAAYLLFQKATH